MKTPSKLAILSAAALITLSSGAVVLAKEHENNQGQPHNFKAEFKINHEADEDNDQDDNHTKTDSNQFEIKGIITAVVGNNFVVNGQTIFIDPSQVGKFKQKGILEVNKKVKVEGIIKNGVMLATEIMVIGEGQGRFKFEIKGSPFPIALPTASPLPTSSLTTSPSPSTLPTASSSASPTATPIATTSTNVKVKAIGTVDQVSAFLQQILNFLKNLAG